MEAGLRDATLAAAAVATAVGVSARVTIGEVGPAARPVRRVGALLAAALLVVAAALIVGTPPLAAARLATLVVLCLAIAEIDLRLQIVPDALVAAVLLVAVVAPFPLDRTAQLVGTVVTGGLFMGVRQAHLWWRGEDGLGLGDVKLAAAMGALLGAEVSLLAAATAAAGTAAWIAARRLKGSGHVVGAPLGVGLAASTAAAAIWTAVGR